MFPSNTNPSTWAPPKNEQSPLMLRDLQTNAYFSRGKSLQLSQMVPLQLVGANHFVNLLDESFLTLLYQECFLTTVLETGHVLALREGTPQRGRVLKFTAKALTQIVTDCFKAELQEAKARTHGCGSGVLAGEPRFSGPLEKQGHATRPMPNHTAEEQEGQDVVNNHILSPQTPYLCKRQPSANRSRPHCRAAVAHGLTCF